MSHRSVRRWFPAALLMLGTALALSFVPAPVRGQSLREETSLAVIPADVAFYGTSLRLREQWDSLVNSNAVAKLKEMPLLQVAQVLIQQQLEQPTSPELADALDFFRQPENQQLIELAKDAVSHEIFLYGDESYVPLMRFLNKINQLNRTAQLEQIQEQGADGVNGSPGDSLKVLLDAFNQAGDLKVPNTVIGFKLSNAAQAQAQIKRLEELLQEELADEPEFAGRLTREKLGDDEFLTLKLDGKMLPWEELEVDDLDEDIRAKAEQAIAKVKKLTMAISIGVRSTGERSTGERGNAYLVVAAGETTEYLASWGQGDLLVDRDELKPVLTHADKQITGISYTSAAFLKAANSTEQQLDELVAAAPQLAAAAELDADVQQELAADAKKFVEQLKPYLPTPGAITSFNFTTDKGVEGYTYNWGINPMLDASQPLSLLNHVGGDPICFIAGHGKQTVESYEFCETWCKRAFYYADKIAASQLDEDELDFYQKVRKDLQPQFEELNRITRELMIPALAPGQSAIVFDAKAASKQWSDRLPESDQALPMLELGLVYAVSDAQKLKEGAAGYFQTAQEIINKLHAIEPEDIPDMQMVPPEVRELDEGRIYYYRLPAALGIDRNVAPNAGLSQKVLALSAIPQFTRRLLNEEPLANEGGIDLDRPAAVIFHFDFSRFVDALTPWVDYGLALNYGGEDQVPIEFRDQLRTALEVAKCWKSSTAITYREGDAWVTHMQSRFQDLQ